jgi:hypothetical protein
MKAPHDSLSRVLLLSLTWLTKSFLVYLIKNKGYVLHCGD